MTTDITLGAWKFGGGTYHFIRGDRMGEIPSAGLSEYDAIRVNLAIKAIQRQLEVQGFDPHRYDGVFGFFTRYATKQFQTHKALSFTIGEVGRTTMGGLLRPMARRLSKHLAVPRELVAGIPIHEAGWDPAAVGASTPIEKGIDRGLFQINTIAHPDVSDEQAFDAVFNMNWGAKTLRERYEKYSKQTDADTAWDCAVAANLSPVAADDWASGGTPSDTVKKFVTDVKAYGKAYWG